MEQRMGERQRWAWLSGGVSVAVGACACGLGWLWVLAGGLLVGLYYINIERLVPASGLSAVLPKTIALLTLLWTVVALAWSANLADSAFPMVDGFPALGWTMLAVAAWGSKKGSAACARCAGILCLFLLILYGMITVFAVPDVQINNLKPTGTWKNGMWAVGLFLLPAGVWYLPCKTGNNKGRKKIGLFLPLASAVLAAVTAGVLSPLLAASVPSPLYTLAQSVSLFGVVERIEPLLSAAMIMGVFCLLSAMTCTCRALADRLCPWKWSGVAACIAAGALMGMAKNIPIAVIAAGGVVISAAIPICVLSAVTRRKENHNG